MYELEYGVTFNPYEQKWVLTDERSVQDAGGYSDFGRQYLGRDFSFQGVMARSFQKTELYMAAYSRWRVTLEELP